MPNLALPWDFAVPDENSPLTPLEQLIASASASIRDKMVAAQMAISVASPAQRDSFFPSPQHGDAVFRRDTGWEERYYSLYNVSTNPGGAAVAGWYPVAGSLPQALAKGTASASDSPGSWVIGPVALTAGYQVGGFTASGASAYTIGVPFPGLYDVEIYATFASSTAGSLRAVRLVADGTVLNNYETRRSSGITAGNFGVQGSFQGVTVQSTLQLQTFHDSSGALATTDRTMVIRYVGPAPIIQNA
jgi:hypothetical protein